ncbi:hypothetical protein Hanom_Chr04g00310891 [Helianthus anomalus]
MGSFLHTPCYQRLPSPRRLTSFEYTRQNLLFFRIPLLLFSCQQFQYIFAFHSDLLF